jgi:demethylmenaquinone methyltransferase/2-methoxy-6-polyprenyl-1,4-benzoquinol methylase
MLQYYEKRQREYEAIYAKPERQHDLAWLEQQLTTLVSGRGVLEIACGTGYWTRRISRTALSVLATDASAQLAESAVSSCPSGNVRSGALDAFAIPASAEFDCLVAGFFFSHIFLRQQRQFLNGIAKALKPSSKIVLFDNRFVEASSTPICRRTPFGDTYQTRRLADGTEHEVLKNFPSASELSLVLNRFCSSVSIQESQYFWLASGQIGG